MPMPHAADASPAPGLPATDDGFLTPFLRHATATPERIFARLGGSVLTFGALDTLSARLAARLRAAGVKPGDRVALMLRNSETALALMFAIARIGAVWVPVNTQAVGDNLAYVLSHSGPRAIIAEPDLDAGRIGLRRRSAVRRPWSPPSLSAATARRPPRYPAIPHLPPPMMPSPSCTRPAPPAGRRA